MSEITSIKQLIEYKDGEVIELPPFSANRPFFAKLRRPSLLVMAKQKMIPNTLLPQANALFFGEINKGGKRDDDSLIKLFDIIEVLCESAFVEPKYSEIKEAGIELTDEQYLAVFNYTQDGVKSLSSFRKE